MGPNVAKVEPPETMPPGSATGRLPALDTRRRRRVAGWRGGNHLPLAAASVTIEHYGIHHYIFDFINLTQDFSIVLTFDLYSIVYPNTPYSS